MFLMFFIALTQKKEVEYFNLREKPMKVYQSMRIARKAFVVNEQELTMTMYRDYLKITIPEEFVDAFYYYTVHDIASGLELVAIGKRESRWKEFKSKKNKDGSYDYGPLQLNSNNIKNKKFMATYSPLEEEKHLVNSDNHLYMIVCIKYYLSLKKYFNSEMHQTLKVYNGGYRALSAKKNTRLYKQTESYASMVTKAISGVKENYKTYVTKNEHSLRLSKIVSMMKEQNRIKEEQRISILSSFGARELPKNVRRLTKHKKQELFTDPRFFKDYNETLTRRYILVIV